MRKIAMQSAARLRLELTSPDEGTLGSHSAMSTGAQSRPCVAPNGIMKSNANRLRRDGGEMPGIAIEVNTGERMAPAHHAAPNLARYFDRSDPAAAPTSKFTELIN